MDGSRQGLKGSVEYVITKGSLVDLNTLWRLFLADMAFKRLDEECWAKSEGVRTLMKDGESSAKPPIELLARCNIT